MDAMDTLFKPFIEQQGLMVLDGALATELEQRGANLNDSLWSAKLLTENPDLIRQVHYDYIVAGANVITTASYQASYAGFAKRGYTNEQATALMQLSVQLAKEARAQAMTEKIYFIAFDCSFNWTLWRISRRWFRISRDIMVCLKTL